MLAPERRVEVHALASQSSLCTKGGYSPPALPGETLNQLQTWLDSEIDGQNPGPGIQRPSLNIGFPITCQRPLAWAPHDYLSEPHRSLCHACPTSGKPGHSRSSLALLPIASADSASPVTSPGPLYLLTFCHASSSEHLVCLTPGSCHTIETQ